MKPLQKIILVLAAIWIAVKLVLFYTGNALDSKQIVASLNIGFVLFIIYKALQQRYATKDTKDLGFLGDFIASMKAASFYTVIIFGFLVVYYAYIDKLFFEELVGERVILLKEEIDSQGGYDTFIETLIEQKTLPEGGENVTENEYYEQVKTNWLQSLNLKLVLPVLLMGLFFLNLACSAIFSAVYKRVFLKQA